MAKKKAVENLSSQAETEHFTKTELSAEQIKAIYRAAAKEFGVLASTISLKNDKLFSFSDYPSTNARVNKILSDMMLKTVNVINGGTRDAWIRSATNADKIIERIFQTSDIEKKVLEGYKDRNLSALTAFQKRKVDGLNLSDRVLKNIKSYKKEVELTLDVAIGEGKGAKSIANLVNKAADEPERIFRRVRDKRGNLVQSKAAEAFNPGQGVYKSSYKNALRIIRTEINMSYRLADWTKWQKQSHIVGFEVKLSNNPNHCPLCIALAGKYPKEFLFQGWHPQCRCRAIPILKTDEELLIDDERMLEGKKPLKASVNTVSDLPEGFKQWTSDPVNIARYKRAKSKPYWIRDNFKNGDITKGYKNARTSAKKPQNG